MWLLQVFVAMLFVLAVILFACEIAWLLISGMVNIMVRIEERRANK